MGKRTTKPSLQEALDRLASLFEFGALEAVTAPTLFIHRVCDEIERLRREARETPGGTRGR